MRCPGGEECRGGYRLKSMVFKTMTGAGLAGRDGMSERIIDSMSKRAASDCLFREKGWISRLDLLSLSSLGMEWSEGMGDK